MLTIPTPTRIRVAPDTDARLLAAAAAFIAASEGACQPDVSPLEWLSALLTDLGESDYPATTEDPEAAWDALIVCGGLLDRLRAALAQARGN